MCLSNSKFGFGLNMREGGWGRSLYVGEFCVKWVNFISHGRGGEGGCVMGGICVTEPIIKLNKHLLS